jgi:hypothetical protein
MPDLGVTELIFVGSRHSKDCKVCDKAIPDFEDLCNHILKDHGLKLLHIGQEGHSDGTHAFFETVAVFGVPKKQQQKSGSYRFTPPT